MELSKVQNKNKKYMEKVVNVKNNKIKKPLIELTKLFKIK